MLTLLRQKLNFSPTEIINRGPDTLIIVAGLCGFLIHVAFTALFLYLMLWPMALLNVLSCAVWVGIIALAVHERSAMAVHVGTAEVVTHAVIATLLLGPNFGFHFYLWPISILIALNPNTALTRSAVFALMAILLFGCLSTFVETDRSGEYATSIMKLIFFSNILVAGFSMILTGLMVRRMFSLQSQVLQQHARTDELTRLYNRRYILEFLQITENNRRRNRIPYCVCICDLDHFKQINDNFGHDTGDTVLVNFSEFLQKSLRQTDCVARWGGEEFLVVLTNTGGKSARNTINTLLTRLRTDKRIETGKGMYLSMSVGIAEAGDNISVDELVIRADKALYDAKSAGRDRSVLHIEQPD